jgi:hypothetical protein
MGHGGCTIVAASDRWHTKDRHRVIIAQPVCGINWDCWEGGAGGSPSSRAFSILDRQYDLYRGPNHERIEAPASLTVDLLPAASDLRRQHHRTITNRWDDSSARRTGPCYPPATDRVIPLMKYFCSRTNSRIVGTAVMITAVMM